MRLKNLVNIDLLRHLAVYITRNFIEYKLVNFIVKAYVPLNMKLLLILFLRLCPILNTIKAIPLA